MAAGSLNAAGGGMWWRGGLLVVAVAAVFGVAFAPKGCEDSAGGKVQTVRIGDKTFHLEIADTDAVRMKGLGQRDHIDADGGMLFVFAQPHTTSFVMRDCPIPIDIIYLDQFGKVITSYQMQPLPPRGEGEGKPGETNPLYEERLGKTGYPSRLPTQFVIELKGGTIPSLNLKEGQKIDLPLAALKSRVK